MTVRELKAIEPLAEAYEFNPETRYLVQMKGRGANLENAHKVAEGLKENGLNVVIAMGDLTFYELPE